jgi:hypothetical protein
MTDLAMPEPGRSSSLPRQGKAARRIIAVKTSSAPYFRSALARLRAGYPDAELYVWSEERESEEYYRDDAVSGVILYLNGPGVPAMVRQLWSLEADLVVTQATREVTYDKMKFFAYGLFPGPGLVYDSEGLIVGHGSWSNRLLPTLGDVVGGWRAAHHLRWTPIRLIRLLGEIVPIVLFPIVLVRLILGALRAEVGRQWYLRHNPGGPRG